MWYVYFLKCRDKSIYTGITTNLKKRIGQHTRGQGSKYTKGRRGVKLLGYEKHPDRAAATKRERYLKGLTRSEKKVIITGSLRPAKRVSG